MSTANPRPYTAAYREAEAEHKRALARFEADKTAENHRLLLIAHYNRITACNAIPESERNRT